VASLLVLFCFVRLLDGSNALCDIHRTKLSPSLTQQQQQQNEQQQQDQQQQSQQLLLLHHHHHHHHDLSPPSPTSR